jgi:hypothetical protein
VVLLAGLKACWELIVSITSQPMKLLAGRIDIGGLCGRT